MGPNKEKYKYLHLSFKKINKLKRGKEGKTIVYVKYE